ncbi:MAG: glycosyltransferase family 4 protein [Paracoccaceae bacterium]
MVQITDKPQGGGGIRRAVELQAASLTACGWRVKTCHVPFPLRSASQIAALQDAISQADLVHLHLGFTGLSVGDVERIARHPFVVFLHDISPFEHDPNLGRDFDLPRGSIAIELRRALQRGKRQAVWDALVSMAAAFCVPSGFIGDLARAGGATEVRLLPHPVATPDRVVPLPAAQRLLFVGRLSAEKGAEEAVRAVATLPKAHLTVLGDGPLMSELRAVASRLRVTDRVTFVGSVSSDHVRAAIREADVLLHPSRVPEGLGLAGVEALAEGRAVVGTGLGGAADWLKDGETGWVCAPDPKVLAQTLTEALSDPEELARRGMNGARLVAQHYAPKVVADHLDALCHAALAEGPA